LNKSHEFIGFDSILSEGFCVVFGSDEVVIKVVVVVEVVVEGDVDDANELVVTFVISCAFVVFGVGFGGFCIKLIESNY
jgi:hypothetical protein